jgi:HSP20 family molecular chaperone IbpA
MSIYNSIFWDEVHSLGDILRINTYDQGFTRVTTNLLSDDDNVVLKMDIPGVSKENVTVEIDDSILYVTAKRDENTTYKGKWKMLDVDCENIKAKTENGELTITLSRNKSKKNKKIVID